MEKKTVEENWESFWKPIVTNPDGSINIDQLKKELSDFSFVMEQVPKVYCHITGNRMSYITYKAEDVIRVADDHFNEMVRDAIKDELEEENTQPLLTDEDVKAWEDMKKQERASTRVSEPYEPNARLRYWKERAIKSEARESARWVKASERLPSSWYLKCVRFIHSKVPLLDPAAWLEKNPDHTNLVEWLDEEGEKGEIK